MKGSTARFFCAVVLLAAVIGSLADKPKKHQKKYLYKKQGAGGDPALPLPLKSNGYQKYTRGQRSFPPFVRAESVDDESHAGQYNNNGPSVGGIHDFFDRITSTFARTGVRDADREITILPGSNDQSQANPTAFPHAPVPDNLQDDLNSAEKDEDNDSGSDEDENDENDDNNNEEDDAENDEDQEEDDDENNDLADELDGILPQKPKKQNKQKKPASQEAPSDQLSSAQQTSSAEKKPGNKNKDAEKVEEGEEESEEEEEENDEQDNGQVDLPDNIPPFIRQSMLEDIKRRKEQKAQEEAQGGRPGGPGGNQQYGGRPGGQYGGGPQQYGRPGQGPPTQGGSPPRGGGFLSSLFS